MVAVIRCRVLLLCLLLTVTVIPAIAQLRISRIISANDPEAFKVVQFQQSITRDNAATITLLDFAFPQLEDGFWCAELTMKFMKTPDEGGAPEVMKTMRLLFNDVVRKVKDSKVSLSLSNERIGNFIPLREVTDIKIELRLEKVKEEFDGLRRIIAPVLSVPQFSNQNNTFDLFDNVLSSMKSPDDRQPLLFSGMFYVPRNVAEYTKVKADGRMPLISNNDTILIISDGTVPINDGTILGFLKDVINSSTKFVAGKQFIKEKTATFSGLVRLFFSKDPTATLPSPLLAKLIEIKEGLAGPTMASDAVRSAITQAQTKARELEVQGKLSSEARQTVMHFTYLAQIYADMRKVDGTMGAWMKDFRQWRRTVNDDGVRLGMDALGIRDLYPVPSKVARVFVPYGLEDEFRISFYSWQTSLHEAIADLQRMNDASAVAMVSTFLEDVPADLTTVPTEGSVGG